MNTINPIPILLFSVDEYLSLYGELATGKYTIYYLGPAKNVSRYSRFCKKYFVCASTDKALADQINRICKSYAISAVIPLDLSATVCVSRLTPALTCPVLQVSSVSDLILLSNKWKYVDFLKPLRIRYPKTVRIHSPKELLAVDLPKPFLVKPMSQGGGKGIRMMKSKDDIRSYIDTFSPFKTFPLIAQEYIKGTDIDMSVLAKEGNMYGISIQRWLAKGELEFAHDPEVFKVGRAIVEHFTYSGFMHIDMRRDDRSGSLYVLECNPRAWGSMGASIGAGVDFIDLTVRLINNRHIQSVIQPNMTYVTPIHYLSKLLRNPLLLFTSSFATNHELVAIFRDPLPYIALLLRDCFEAIERKLLYMAGNHKRLIEIEKRIFLSHITQ